MSEPAPSPHTGHRAIDAILAELAGLDQLAAPTRLERLGRAHESLQQILTDSAA